jgi:hypothetical protein
MLAAIDKQSYPVLHRLRNRMVNRAFVLRWKRGTEAPLDLGFEAMTEIFIDGLVSRASKWVQLDLRFSVRARCDGKRRYRFSRISHE